MAPIQSVILKPGVDVEMTAALNEAGITQSQLIRTKNGLTQTVGGGVTFGMAAVPSTVKSLHAWQDIQNTAYLGAAATANVVMLTATSNQDVTPQMRTSSVTPDFSISSGSDIVTIVDGNSGLTPFDVVEFHTPISIGNLLLQGAYPVATVISTGSYTIISSVVSSTTIASSGKLPIFTTVAANGLVTVEQPNHTVAAILGVQPSFDHPTSVGDLTIEGPYNVYSVIDSSSYTIISPTLASSNDTQTMSSGQVHFHYYITGAQLFLGAGYGSNGYGGGGYGVGSSASTGDPGTPITATDWTSDNWGEVWLGGQRDGPVFQWSPSNGFPTASPIPQAPLKNGGCFVSMPQQILVCWKSVQSQGNGGFNNGGTQDNLIVRWSDAQDFTQWDVSPASAAGSFHIPTGSIIRGGLQAANYGVIWTDVDVWIMQFIGPTAIFNFTRAGSGCGLIGPHAAGVLAGIVWWCSESNFYALSGNGVEVLPCTVWDFVFQNMNRSVNPTTGESYAAKIVCEPNAAFNEITWSFPSGTNTENNAYVKFNLIDKTWDYGNGWLSRTAWNDVSVLGNPVGADISGTIYQHEEGNMVNGSGNCSFRTGWWAINDGNDLAFVDFVMPDFNWGTYPGTDASTAIQLRFFSLDYPGDTPRSYGPYTVTRANQYVTPRIRGRLMAMEVISVTNDVFWRLGRIRFRYAPSGTR